MKTNDCNWTTNLRKILGAPQRRQRGFMLIDCLVYFSLFLVVMGVAFTFFYACWDGSLSLRRNTDDITRALKAGETWRADVRIGAGPLRTEDSADSQVLHIPQKSGEVVYKFSESSLWRSPDGQASWVQVLPRVKSSRMEPERRRQVVAWRWEIELPTRKKSAQVHPLFTFEAVPQPAANP